MSDFTTWRSLVDGEEIGVIPDSVVSRPDDDDSTSRDRAEGLEIELKSDWPSIGAEISNETSGVTEAQLRETDGGVIDTADISGLSAGDAFTFDDVGLQSGENYVISVDAEGSDYTMGRAADDDYPYTSADVDIVGAFDEDNGLVDTFVRAVNNIGNVGFD